MTRKEPRYNLNYVVQETGIKADTLRAWERRYGLPKPKRTEGGHRLFSDFDIEIIKWLLTQQEGGLRINRAVELWRESQKNEAGLSSTLLEDGLGQARGGEKGNQSDHLDRYQAGWIQACLDFDEAVAEQVLNQALVQLSLETVCVEILQAGLAEIGTLWYQGDASVQQEHFASELAVRRLGSLILAAPQPIRGKTILVACPEAENHTFSALLITLFLRYRSWNVVYLGANVPKVDIRETIEKTKPNLVVMVAMRLVTAATLQDTALSLVELNIPLAFGGGIFNSLTDLHHRLPGIYLGPEISGAVVAIETLLEGPIPKYVASIEPGNYAETKAHFLDKVHLIEAKTLTSLRENNGPGIPVEQLQGTNDYLAQDLVAALSLGDLTLLGSNIEWVKNLMLYQHISDELLFQYFQAYLDAAQTTLGKQGSIIIKWLESTLKHLSLS